MIEPDRRTDSTQAIIDRLAAHGVCYFMHSPEQVPDAGTEPIQPLFVDLAHSSEPRLQAAITALLLRHPEYAPRAEVAARCLSEDDPGRRLLLASILAAAALEQEWAFSLDLYLGARPRIAAEHLAAEWGIASPQVDYGRPALRSAADTLRAHAPFPYNFEEDWENAARRLLDQLKREVPRGT